MDVAAKEVFAADGYANHRVVVFNSETGVYKRHWGAYGKAPSDEKMSSYDPAKPPSPQFGNPVHCIRIDREGLVYVCDRSNNRLQVFHKDGSFVAEHIYEKATLGFGSVYDLVFSPDKEQKFIYVIDGTNGEVRIVDHASKETLGARFGRPGRQIGQFTALHNVAVDRQGNIFTSEVSGQRVQEASEGVICRIDRETCGAAPLRELGPRRRGELGNFYPTNCCTCFRSANWQILLQKEKMSGCRCDFRVKMRGPHPLT